MMRDRPDRDPPRRRKSPFVGPGSWSEPENPRALGGRAAHTEPVQHRTGTPWATSFIVLGIAGGIALWAYAPKSQRKGTSIVAPDSTQATSAPRATASAPPEAPSVPPDRFVGTLPPHALQAALGRQAGPIQTCWRDGLARDPAIGTSVVMEIRVLEDGLVESASRVGGKLTEPRTERCLVDALALLDLPKPTGGPARVRFTLTYQPEADAAVDANASPNDDANALPDAASSEAGLDGAAKPPLVTLSSSTTIEGAYPPDGTTVIGKARGAFKTCYATSLAADPATDGRRVTVTLNVSGAGWVTTTTVAGAFPSALGTCLAGVARKLKFAETSSGDPSKITVTLKFATE
jgi:hypothetical protein